MLSDLQRVFYSTRKLCDLQKRKKDHGRAPLYGDGVPGPQDQHHGTDVAQGEEPRDADPAQIPEQPPEKGRFEVSGQCD